MRYDYLATIAFYGLLSVYVGGAWGLWRATNRAVEHDRQRSHPWRNRPERRD